MAAAGVDEGDDDLRSAFEQRGVRTEGGFAERVRASASLREGLQDDRWPPQGSSAPHACPSWGWRLRIREIRKTLPVQDTVRPHTSPQPLRLAAVSLMSDKKPSRSVFSAEQGAVCSRADLRIEARPLRIRAPLVDERVVASRSPAEVPRKLLHHALGREVVDTRASQDCIRDVLAAAGVGEFCRMVMRRGAVFGRELCRLLGRTSC